jgi:putative spermidine/putrescine transport system permease protein
MLRIGRFVFGTATVLFLLAPLIAILPLAFTSSSMLTYPITQLSIRWFEELATADAWRRSIVNSLIIGSGTTALATVLGTLAALALRRRIAFH